MRFSAAVLQFIWTTEKRQQQKRLVPPFDFFGGYTGFSVKIFSLVLWSSELPWGAVFQNIFANQANSTVHMPPVNGTQALCCTLLVHLFLLYCYLLLTDFTSCYSFCTLHHIFWHSIPSFNLRCITDSITFEFIHWKGQWKYIFLRKFRPRTASLLWVSKSNRASMQSDYCQILCWTLLFHDWIIVQ